jgi:amphi-Trp domain-containing protein
MSKKTRNQKVDASESVLAPVSETKKGNEPAANSSDATEDLDLRGQDNKHHEARAKLDGEETKAKVEYEATLRCEEAAHYLRALADGMANGQITFNQGATRLDLAFGEAVELEVKASSKGVKERLSFEVRWRNARAPRLEIVSNPLA